MKNKASIIKDAQKYASKGQIDKAISAWEKLLAESKDGNIHNTIGDLYLKKGSEAKAIASFTKAAEIFKSEGFFPKAMAIYKKILHIVPNDVNALLSIAKLDADKGMTGSAIENYFRAAEVYKRADELENTIQIVGKITALSVSDIRTRTKIADLYIRSGLKGKAADEYVLIASEYLEKEDLEHAQTFYTKATQLEPRNAGSWVGLSLLAEKSDDIDKAFEFLRTALSHEPKDKDALLGYARLAIESGKTDQAKKTLLRIKETFPLELRAKKLLGDIHLSEGALEEAWEELLQHIDELIEKQSWADAIGYLNRFVEQYPIEVNQRLIGVYRDNGDSENLNQVRKELAGLYKDSDSLDDALQLYRDYLDANPGEQTVIEEIHAIENAIGIPHFSEVPLDEEPESPVEDLITQEVLTGEETVQDEQETQLPEIPPLHGEIDLGGGTEDETVVSQLAADISPEEFAGKKEEADFYAQQGIYDEAIKIYEILVASFPNNEEIKHELDALKSNTAQSEDIVVENDSGEQTETGSDHIVFQDTHNQLDLEGQGHQDPETKDYDRYYNAGMDFKEKGLMEDAIQAFQIASNDPDNMHRNTTLLASCYLDKGAYPHAIAEFNKIIEKMSTSDDGYVDIKYDLAGAYTENKDYNKALELYSEIKELNPQFKDVSDKINALKEQMVVTEEKPKSKKDRVSYI
jgi:tetratricopeptide (TPR) repeat protein